MDDRNPKDYDCRDEAKTAAALADAAEAARKNAERMLTKFAAIRRERDIAFMEREDLVAQVASLRLALAAREGQSTNEGALARYLEHFGPICEHHHDECPDDCEGQLAWQADAELKVLRLALDEARKERDGHYKWRGIYAKSDATHLRTLLAIAADLGIGKQWAGTETFLEALATLRRNLGDAMMIARLATEHGDGSAAAWLYNVLGGPYTGQPLTDAARAALRGAGEPQTIRMANGSTMVMGVDLGREDRLVSTDTDGLIPDP